MANLVMHNVLQVDNRGILTIFGSKVGYVYKCTTLDPKMTYGRLDWRILPKHDNL
jgi:hypothetical protein